MFAVILVSMAHSVELQRERTAQLGMLAITEASPVSCDRPIETQASESRRCKGLMFPRVYTLSSSRRRNEEWFQEWAATRGCGFCCSLKRLLLKSPGIFTSNGKERFYGLHRLAWARLIRGTVFPHIRNEWLHCAWTSPGMWQCGMDSGPGLCSNTAT